MSATVQEVKNYWNNNPLHGYEFSDLGSGVFFEKVDQIKRQDIERFSLDFWRFGDYNGQKVLEVGCGPGWFSVQYAKAGAKLTSIDLTPRAVEITKAHLHYRGVSANVLEANAETLPFPDEDFDFVLSAGVLHHTPDTPRAIKECWRVLKRGGRAKIALYHKGILHSRVLFPIVRFCMNLSKVKHPGADLAKKASDLDDFIRQYDGEGNPVGIAKTTRDWSEILEGAGFKVLHHELHYFPKRFIPFSRWIPDGVHWLCDRWFGTMIYFDLEKT